MLCSLDLGPIIEGSVLWHGTESHAYWDCGGHHLCQCMENTCIVIAEQYTVTVICELPGSKRGWDGHGCLGKIMS